MTLRLIADYMLPEHHPKTYVQGERAHLELSILRHFYCDLWPRMYPPPFCEPTFPHGRALTL